MEVGKIVALALLIQSAGGFSNGNMFGNFARWNEPNRDNSGGKKVDYKVVGPKAASSMMPAGGPQTLLSKPTGNKLHIQVYRALMDAVVLDWTISLADKDRMKTCAVTYWADGEASTTIDPFMPKTRTFLLENLRPSQNYTFNMTCQDVSGLQLDSDWLEFSTLVSNTSDTSSDILNLKILPAISNSIQSPMGHSDPIKVSTTTSLSRSYYTRKTSPHAVLGLSCAIFGAILVGITVALALRRYSQYKRSQTRLWELQAVQDIQESGSMATFINLPPPYSEQPSPLYNLCASSISSGSNLCEQHLRMSNCCHHHYYCNMEFQSPPVTQETTESIANTEITTTDTESTSAF